jgi:hypothetical protein
MMKTGIVRLLAAAVCTRVVLCLTPPRPTPPPEKSSSEVLAALADPSKNDSGIAYFEQPIDHGNPYFGTFSQTYWYNTSYWKGPGSPIILFTPGEVAATTYSAYLTDSAITGLIAKQVGGAVLVVEHRYWGGFWPCPHLSKPPRNAS